MIGGIIVAAIIALIIAGLVAPSDALAWWRRGTVDDVELRWPTIDEAFSRPGEEPQIPDELPDETDHYVVYLSGIGISSPDELPVKEGPMLTRLQERLGRSTLLWDIYPYSVENTALTQGGRWARVWRKLAQWKYEGHRLRFLSSLINVRNAFQVFVSADHRYGPVFNRAIAQQIAAALLRHGYVPEHRKPVTLLGWSGGAQIAAGASWWLAAMGVPVRLMSMAGILASDPGLDRAKKIWHMRGDRDQVQRLGAIFSVRRWPIFKDSSWNRAKRDGRLVEISLGPLTHTGKESYFATEPPMPDGRQPRELTADYIVGVLVHEGLAVDDFGSDTHALPEIEQYPD